jgi:dolichol kinase
MTFGHTLRRLVHLCTPVFLIYYALPNPLWEGGISKQAGLLLALGVVLVFEILRLRHKPKIVGMRDYEYHRVSAAAWAAAGLVIILILFPIQVAAPAVFGMAWVDPLMGEMRARKLRFYPEAPIIVYFLVAFGAITAFWGLSYIGLVAAALGTPVAIWAELKKDWVVDDDFSMLVFPALVYAAVFAAFGAL